MKNAYIDVLLRPTEVLTRGTGLFRVEWNATRLSKCPIIANTFEIDNKY